MLETILTVVITMIVVMICGIVYNYMTSKRK